MRKKVLLLGNSNISIYNYRLELVNRLLAEDYEVYISFPYGELVSALEHVGCHYIETRLERRGKNPFSDARLLVKYLEILKKIKPDVVLTFTIKPNIYGGIACGLKRVPSIVNITGLGTAVEHPGILQKITLFLYRVALRKVQTVFMQNRENEAFFRRHHIAEGKRKLLPGSGVNLNHFQYMDYPAGPIVKFLFIARVMKEKGIDLYLEAARIIRERHPLAEFHVLGYCEEAYSDKLQEFERNGHIRYDGMVDDVREYHRTAHCTVHPSFYPEGMSNVLLEAAACGRPVITTTRSGCRETVEDGVTGFLCEPRSLDGLIDQIERFLALSWEQRRDMGLAGRRKVEREFDREIVVEAYCREMGLNSVQADHKEAINQA